MRATPLDPRIRWRTAVTKTAGQVKVTATQVRKTVIKTFVSMDLVSDAKNVWYLTFKHVSRLILNDLLQYFDKHCFWLFYVAIVSWCNIWLILIHIPDDESKRKIKVAIRPLSPNGNVSGTVDDIKNSVSQLRLSPTAALVSAPSPSNHACSMELTLYWNILLIKFKNYGNNISTNFKSIFSIAIQRKRTTTPIDKKMMKRSQSESDTLE